MTTASIRNLFFEHNGRWGLFGYHGWATMGPTELLIETLLDELGRSKASAARVKQRAEKLIEAYPDYLPAYYVTGLAAYKMRDYQSATDIFCRGLAVAKALLPANYPGRIPWGGPENQAFLRIARENIKALVKLGRITEARRDAAQLLRWDPQDNVRIGRILAELNYADVA